MFKMAALQNLSGGGFDFILAAFNGTTLKLDEVNLEYVRGELSSFADTQWCAPEEFYARCRDTKESIDKACAERNDVVARMFHEASDGISRLSDAEVRTLMGIVAGWWLATGNHQRGEKTAEYWEMLRLEA